VKLAPKTRAPASTTPWSVYVLRCSGGTLYTGITNDLEQRLKAHRTGRGAKYTRGRLPLDLVHQEPAASRGDAARRERQIRGLGRRGKLALIAASSGVVFKVRGP
jgi:putative endonuclease